jgi:hypothetical protein
MNSRNTSPVGACPFGSERRDNVALRVTGACYPGFFRADTHARTVPARTRDRRPEVTARAGFAERERGQAPAGGDLPQRRSDVRARPRRGYRCRAERVHEIDHRD